MEAQVKTTWRASPPVAAREDCTMCRGTGWQLLSGAGRASAKRCPCTTLGRLLDLKNRVRIPDRYQHCTLDRYAPTSLSQMRALSEARRFANCYPQTVRDLFLTGGPGTGKTHLAVGIAQELVRRFCDDVLFIDFGGFVSSLLENDYSENRRNSQWECARQASLLVLDNFGMIRPSAEKAHIAEELILTRLRARRRTIYSGECFKCRGLFSATRSANGASSTEKLLRALSPRALMELLGNSRIILVEGQDYRMRKGCDHRLFG